MKPLLLLILDGWGIAPASLGNAIKLAKKPNFDRLWEKYPHTLLHAHGQFVGLPKDQVGNSEAGHMNIGAGREIKQDAVLISEAIADGRFQKNLAFKQAIDHVKKNNSALHLLGLVSDGESPHSSLDHLYALVDLAYGAGLTKIYLHLITDGRDAPQFSALKIIDCVLKKIYGKATIASILGRFFAMDRGKNWDRAKKAYDCLTIEGGLVYPDYRDAILHAYNQKITDEYIEPSIVCKDKKQVKDSRVKDDDAIIFFNLRSDRARQLTKCFVQDEFNKLNPGAFKRIKVAKNLFFCAFTDFGPDLDDIATAFPSSDVKHTLPILLKEKKQLYVAETEKYAHVTYFMNGGFADPVNGEDRLRIPSLKVKSYAMKPEMSVYEITGALGKFIKKDGYDFYVANFANPDMVGHTGDIKAVIKAIEHVDVCLGRLVNLILRKKGDIIVTADHGNAEKMLDLTTNEIWTEHTTNPVPFMLVSDAMKGAKLRKGKLGNIAPTIYEIFGEKKLPKVIDESLII
ncbi:MAG: 2,3-bisphosphoglycerate-independent phosphoglycerate mutase [Parcubacteria group bacterium]